MSEISERIAQLPPEKQKLLQELVDLGALGEESLEIKNSDWNTDLERLIARVWSEVLVGQAIKPGDDFFDLGGDSIHSIQIIAKLHKEGVLITNKDLFENPSVSELAILIEARKSELS